MGDMEWVLLGISVALMLACGVFGAAEYSFVAVDRAAVERAAATGDRAALGVRKALRNLSTQLSGAQVGVTVTNLAIGFLAEPAIAEILRGPLRYAGVPRGAVTGVAVTIALVLATVATMLVGELIPKKIGIAVPLQAALATQGVMRLFTTVVGPAIRVLNGSANAIVRAVGVEPQRLGHHRRRHHHLADRGRGPLAARHGHRLLDVDGPDDVVRAALDDGELRVARRRGELDDLAHGVVDVDDRGAHPGCHDLAGRARPEGDRALHQVGGLLVEGPL
jgi:hypothetical protein